MIEMDYKGSVVCGTANVNFKKMNPNATVPTYGSPDSAGMDLYACIDEDVRINPNENKLIPTGIAMNIPRGYFGALYARSGLALKENIIPANCTGVIDSDFYNEIQVIAHNNGDQVRVIHPQERIAQLVIQPYLRVELNEVDELEKGERTGGFGSTGKF